MGDALKVGDKLWRVAGDYGRPPVLGRPATVAKIGRKWATLDGWQNERIDLETLVIDGGQYSSPGRCYHSRVAYENERLLKKHWEDFVSRLARSSPPDGVTLQWLEAARRDLGLPPLKADGTPL